MSDKRTRKRSRDDGPSRGRADLERLRRMTEAEIAATSPPELADLPEDFWDDAVVVTPPPKEAIIGEQFEDLLSGNRASGEGDDVPRGSTASVRSPPPGTLFETTEIGLRPRRPVG